MPASRTTPARTDVVIARELVQVARECGLKEQLTAENVGERCHSRRRPLSNGIDNRKVLRPYSDSMKSLIKRRKYNAGKRPSEHGISDESFLTDHGGSIALNLLELERMDENREVRLPNAFSASHTTSNDFFFRTCREREITPHPARMPIGLAASLGRALVY